MVWGTPFTLRGNNFAEEATLEIHRNALCLNRLASSLCGHNEHFTATAQAGHFDIKAAASSSAMRLNGQETITGSTCLSTCANVEILDAHLRHLITSWCPAPEQLSAGPFPS